MITYGIFNPQSFVAPASPIVLNQLLDKTITYLRILNNSPFQLSINLDGIITQMSEFWQKDIAVPLYFQGNLTITPSVIITSISHAQAYQLTIQGLTIGDGGGGLDSAIPQQAVNLTATGKPIYTATFTASGALTGGQHLSIFNPSNSGVVAEIHYAAVFTTDTNTPTANLIYETVDPNLTTAIPIVSHSGIVNPPISVMHATAQDLSGTFFNATQTVETLTVPPNVVSNMPIFPDTSKLPPGQGFILELSGTAQTKTIRLTLKWTEDTVVPPIVVTGALAVASSLKNDNNPVGTSFIESTPTGGGQAWNIFVDGHGTISVDQSGTPHQTLKFNTGGNPLQIGQAGDISEVLGQLTVDQLVTLVGNLVAGGGINVNTIRDNVTGAQQLLLTTAGITIVNSLQAALKFFLGGTLGGFQIISGVAVAVAGTSIAHTLGVVPTMVIGILNEGAAGTGVIGWNRGTATSTHFTAFVTPASTCDFLVMG